LRAIVGVEGLAGHALPAMALARALADRGHEVRFQSFSRWRETAEGFGLGFAGAEASLVEGLGPGARIAEVVRGLLPGIEEFAPDVVVSDALTMTPGLAAEAAGVRAATIYPEVYPYGAPGLPPFSLGLLPPRTRLGALGWRAFAPLARTRLPATAWMRAARAALNAERAELGLAPVDDFGPVVGGPEFVATLPELEYPREWPAGVEVTGPMGVDLPQPAGLELPPGDDPLVLVAPSTVKDPERRLVATALEALAGEPVRVVASTSGAARPSSPPPPNAVVAEWIDYADAMPRASLVVSNGTHGTIVKALGLGVPLAIAPAMADDAEHGVRVAWAGAGLTTTRRPPSPRALRSVVRRVLADRGFAERAGEIAAANAGRNGARRAAELVEAYAAR